MDCTLIKVSDTRRSVVTCRLPGLQRTRRLTRPSGMRRSSTQDAWDKADQMAKHARRIGISSTSHTPTMRSRNSICLTGVATVI